MEDPDRLEAAHVRHENIDDHQIERRAFERPKPGLAAVGDGHRKVVALKIDLDGLADHRIVVNDENMRHALS